MHVSHSIPCALSSSQARVVFRDLCRTVNYYSAPGREIAQVTARGLIGEHWHYLPEWVHSFEIYEAGEEVKLHLDLHSGVASADIKTLTDELARDLSILVSHPVQPFRTRVFCIGWSKTGTTSLTQALRILGLFSWHWAPWVIGFKHICSQTSEFRIDFSGVVDYTAMADLPICALYRELDEVFPGSLFILATRPLERWIASATADIENCIKWIGHMDAVERWAYGTDVIDKEVFQKRYLQHQEQVLDYFSGRPDFLTMDISEGNPWPQLCEFLQLPVPDLAFPHLNRRRPE